MSARFEVDKSLSFERAADGAVRVVAEGKTFTIPANLWASLVLTMTEFSERSGDWQRFMDHHMGRVDRLSPSPIPAEHPSSSAT